VGRSRFSIHDAKDNIGSKKKASVPLSDAHSSEKNETRPFMRQRLSRRQAKWYELWDVIAIIAAIISLLLIMFDWFYRHTPLPTRLSDISPALNDHAHWASVNETHIDLCFVAFFVVDIAAGWIMSIVNKQYYRWFFYPFVHWYDVLGSLPFPGLRWLRILRVIGLGIRLQNSGTIDVRTWKTYTFFHKYYDIVMEELSDRIANKLLSNAQEDLREGNGLKQNMISRVLIPYQEQWVSYISHHVLDISRSIGREHSAQLENYLKQTTRRVVSANSGVKALNQLPFGKSMTHMLESSLTDVVEQLVRETHQSMYYPSYEAAIQSIVHDAFNNTLKDSLVSEQQFSQLMIECLQVIKEEIAIQRWKTRYEDDPSQ